MGLFDSNSKSSQTQITVGLDDTSGREAMGGLQNNISGIGKTGKIVTTYTQNGISEAGLVSAIDSINKATSKQFNEALIAQSGLQSQLAEAVSAIAQSATGTQTEPGRLIGQLTLPALILFGIWMVFRK